jgi:hypothetical protein
MLARQFPGNREIIREFSPTWQGDDSIVAAVSDHHVASSSHARRGQTGFIGFIRLFES